MDGIVVSPIADFNGGFGAGYVVQGWDSDKGRGEKAPVCPSMALLATAKIAVWVSGGSL